jgi:hypothetical protein
MKTGFTVIIASVGIASLILGLLVLANQTNSLKDYDILDDEQKSYFQKWWDDQIKLYPYKNRISEKKEITPSESLIKINGLRSKYATFEPIRFEVLAIGDGSGCILFNVTIRENENTPPVYSQDYISICDVTEKYVGIPLYLDINSKNSQINLQSGKYEVLATYYQDRASFGDVKQEFTITNSSENNIYSSSTSETPESLLVQFEILANENTRLQDEITLKMQELGSVRANKSDTASSLGKELDIIKETLKQNEIKLDELRIAISKFYEVDPQLKRTLEDAQQILTDNHDVIPWIGLGVDNRSKTLWIEFENSDLADKYAPVIKKLIGEDIPITVFVGKNTFD